MPRPLIATSVLLSMAAFTSAHELVAAHLAPAADPPRRPAIGVSGMVASAHPLATEAGLEILRDGGNAFDAAVAIASTLNVVEPMMSGMGGYGTILVFDAKAGESHYLDASGKIPIGVDADVYRAPTPNYMQNRIGPKAVSTPGALNAWQAMSQRFGQLPWQRVLETATRHAEQGFIIDERTASLIGYAFDDFPAHARAIYGNDGGPLRAGDRLVQSDLASSLRLVAEKGAAAMYGGALGQAVDDAMSESGGFLSMQDLTNDRAEWWTPLRIDYRGYEVVTPSAPAGAFPMLVRLGMMNRSEPKQLGHNTLEYLHRFAEITKHAYWTRLAFSGDPDVKLPPYDLLLSEAYWDEQIRLIDMTKASVFSYDGIVEAQSENTTHFVVADRRGNVVSATLTLGNAFGSRIMPEGAGIWLNNSLRYCTFEPKGNPMDAHPGRRKLSSDAPSFILRDGKPWVALGTPGGHTITQTVAQMILNIIEFDMDINDALASPRIAFVEPNWLVVEPEISESIRTALAERGHEVNVRHVGNAHGLMIDYDAETGRPIRFHGAADPRGTGLAKGY